MQRRIKREPSKQARIDAHLSAISRAEKPAMIKPPDEDEVDGYSPKDMSPLVADNVVLSGFPTGAHPMGDEVPWDPEAQPEDEEDEVVRLYERGTPVIGRCRK